MKIRLPLLCCLAFSVALQSQTISRRSVDIPKLQAVPQLDGRLLDTVWNQAARTGDFTTSTPVFGRTPAGATEVYLFYTDEALYVAAVCKSALVRTDGGTRDHLNSGDLLGIGLDTWNDDQNAFQFAVNAAGVQADGRTSSFSYDAEYDTRWQSAVAVSTDGWAVEMRIPFTALRFPPGGGEQVWGLQFTRFDRGSGELSTWSPQDPNVGDGVWQYGDLTGIRAIRQGFRRSVQLYNTADFRSGDSREYTTQQYGADMRLGWQSNTTLDMTLFPTMTSLWGKYSVSSGNQKTTDVGGEAPYPRQFNAEEGGIWVKTWLPEGNANVLTSQVTRRIPDGASFLSASGGTPWHSVRLTTRTRQNTGISLYNSVMGPIRADYVLNDAKTFDTLLQKVSNYNVIIAEQALKNNGWVSLSNANIQAGQGVAYNRATLNAQIANRSNTLRLNASQAISRQGFGDGGPALSGWDYNYSISRINRRFGWRIAHSGQRGNFIESVMAYQRPSPESRITPGSDAGISWTDFRPQGRFQNYRLALSSFYRWNSRYWNGLRLSATALDRRFQTWGAYLHILSPPGEQRFSYNGNIIRRSVSSTTSLEAHYQTDQRRRFILNTTLFGTIRGRHEGSSLYMRLYPRWVLHPRLILGAYTTIAESYNNLRVIGSIQGKWLFERYQSRTLYTGININYYLNKRWWAGVDVSWNDEWWRRREGVLLQADKSLTPVPDYTPTAFRRPDDFNFRASLQWQLRQIDYLRLSYTFDQRPLIDNFNPYRDQELQLRMIFFLDGPR